MTKEEIMQWIKEAEYVTTDRCDYDERGNKWQTNIYKKDGKLYSLSFCNDCICHKTKTKELTVYEPMPVRKKKKTIVVSEYEPVK